MIAVTLTIWRDQFAYTAVVSHVKHFLMAHKFILITDGPRKTVSKKATRFLLKKNVPKDLFARFDVPTSI